MTNSEDEIIIKSPDNTLIDQVIYTSGFVYKGSSTQLCQNHYDHIGNDLADNWCKSESVPPGGDKGSPQILNDSCIT